MPQDLDEQLAATADLASAREELGDEVDVPRSVDHTVRVSRKRAQALVADLEAAGFRVYNRKSRIKVTLEFDRDDAVDRENAARFTEEVVGIADSHDADYDGWGAMILPRDRKVWSPPGDAMAPDEVDVGAEEAYLREIYAQRLVDDGCSADTAVKLSKSVKLQVSEENWHLLSEQMTLGLSGGYSRSAARETIAEMAALVVEDNRSRRKPAWNSRGDQLGA